jgi:hypothetical protein
MLLTDSSQPEFAMNKDIYRDLIHDLVTLVGLDDQFELIHASGNLIFKDVALTIFLGDNELALVNVFVDFGMFPQDRAEEIFRRLLEINLLVSSQGSPRLGLDPQTGRVIFSCAYPLQGLTAQKLLGGIDMAVRQAAVWRSNFYLDGPPLHLHRQPDLRHAIHI